MSLTINGKKQDGIFANLLATIISTVVLIWIGFIFLLVALMLMSPFIFIGWIIWLIAQ